MRGRARWRAGRPARAAWASTCRRRGASRARARSTPSAQPSQNWLHARAKIEPTVLSRSTIVIRSEERESTPSVTPHRGEEQRRWAVEPAGVAREADQPLGGTGVRIRMERPRSPASTCHQRTYCIGTSSRRARAQRTTSPGWPASPADSGSGERCRRGRPRPTAQRPATADGDGGGAVTGGPATRYFSEIVDRSAQWARSSARACRASGWAGADVLLLALARLAPRSGMYSAHGGGGPADLLPLALPAITSRRVHDDHRAGSPLTCSTSCGRISCAPRAPRAW